jgi:hypothetical protein
VKVFKPDLSISEEIQAVVDFISEQWEPIENLHAVVSGIQKAAFHDGRASFDALDAGTFISEIQRRRVSLLQALHDDPVEKDNAPYYDALIRVLTNISTELSNYAGAGLNVDGKWDFPKQVSAAKIAAGRISPSLANVVPRGWAAYKAKYPDCDGVDDYKPEEARDLFKGSDIENHRTAAFVEQLSLHNLQWSVGHGRSPQYTLISAIYAHFSLIADKIATHDLMAGIDKLADWDLPALTFETPDLDAKGSVMLGLLCKHVAAPYTRDEYEDCVKSTIEFNAKPKAERDAIIKANSDRMMEQTTEFLKGINSDIADGQKAAARAVREAFTSTATLESRSPSPM